MSKIDFSKPIQMSWNWDSQWEDVRYVGRHPDSDTIHCVLVDGDFIPVVEEALRNKPESITSKQLYDNLYQEAVQEGLGWATPSQIKDMLFEKLVAFGVIDQEAVYEAK